VKKAVKVSLALLLLLLGLVVIGGWLLRPTFRVERSLVIQAPAAAIYAHLDSPAGWQRWGAWYRRDPAMQLSQGGAAQGQGASWRWSSASQGRGSIELTVAEPGQRIAYELRIDDFAPSSGELRLESEGSGTRVIWLMQGDVGGNPLNRWFALFMDRLVGPDFEEGLANLKRLSEGGR